MKFSLCMIVKNEAAVLQSCLDSLKDIMDEIIIVDTGSSDATKKIAHTYTPYVYDFEWQDDFSAARNFAFSKATGDYIYSADADETLDEANREKLKTLKRALIPEVEIVQMIYVTEQENHPTENFARDRRPKLFKRLREFTWIEPIHEIVNTAPAVYDSDIEVIHRPQGSHSGRDFRIFEKVINEKGALSDRLLGMYLRELYKAGTCSDLENARVFLENVLDDRSRKGNMVLCRQIIAVLLKAYRQAGDAANMLKASLRQEATTPSAEICMELGSFFMEKEDFEEAALWFGRAAFDCESEIDVASSGAPALEALALSCRRLAGQLELNAFSKKEYEVQCAQLLEKANKYELMAREWKPAVPVLDVQ